MRQISIKSAVTFSESEKEESSVPLIAFSKHLLSGVALSVHVHRRVSRWDLGAR
jgi:hypothetical protein